MIKAIIFDWEKTLYEKETGRPVEGALEILKHYNPNYVLGLVSLARTDTPEQRRQQMRESGLEGFFEHIEIAPQDKDASFEEIVKKLGFSYNQIAVVDDRTVRGIKWGNSRGCMTIWLQRGKFANELPNEETGQPSYTIRELKGLLSIL